MNVDKITNAKAETAAPVNPVTAHKKQLQQQGLQQAAQFMQQETSVTVSASQTTISYKVVNRALASNVEIDGQRPLPSEKPPKDENLFDFEEVAKNVMGFVGSVIRGAAAGGAEKEQLQSLFGQAREGVAKGIAQARQDLSGWLNDDISQGITDSESLIENKMVALEDDVFGRAPVVTATQLEQLNSREGDLIIRTREGDEVTVRFADVQTAKYQQYGPSQATPASEPDASSTNSNTETYSRAQWHATSSFSFSISGELNEQELAGITELVNSTYDLATTFFDGDIDKAFEQANGLTFDKEVLAGYAMQLTRTQSSSVVKAYESVQGLSGEELAKREGEFAIADYIQKMLNNREQAEQTLATEQDIGSLVQGIINQMQEVHTPDLISAINRFTGFNQQLSNALDVKE